MSYVQSTTFRKKKAHLNYNDRLTLEYFIKERERR